jgi:hypothetical protein
LRHTKVHLRDHSLRGKLEETKGIIRGRKKGQVIQQPKEKKGKRTKTDLQTLHIKLNIEQYEPH